MSKKKKRMSKSTCLHCVFMKALRDKWKGRGKTSDAKADMIASAMKIVHHAIDDDDARGAGAIHQGHERAAAVYQHGA